MAEIRHSDCITTVVHAPHLWTERIEGIPTIAKCYGWTVSDEFLRMADIEWPQWDEKHWGFDRD